MSTNKELLAKGLKRLLIVIFLFIISPILLTIAFKSLKTYSEGIGNIISYIVLVIASVLILFSIVYAIKTFKIILKSIFTDK